MEFIYDIGSVGPRNPAPDEPDTPHPGPPRPSHEPPNVDPVTEPAYDPDPGIEPIREPESVPSFPEPLPGGPPNVFV